MKLNKYIGSFVPDLKGKNIMITGSSAGLGFEASKIFAYKGAKLHFLIRNEEKMKKRIEEIKEYIKGDFEYAISLYDQSNLGKIKECVSSLDENEHIDAIILNAGIYYPDVKKRGEFGGSYTFHVNSLADLFLFELLRRKYPHARYVFVTSVMNLTPKKNDFAYYVTNTKDKRGREYGYSKRAMMGLYEYAKSLGLEASICHPGICGTDILTNFSPKFKKAASRFLNTFLHKADKASLTEVLAATYPLNGKDYFVPRGIFHFSGFPKRIKAMKKMKKTMKFVSDCLPYLDSFI